MAVEAYTSNQLADGYRGSPVDDHGKMRVQTFKFDALTTAGDATSTFEMCKLPPGRVRLILPECRVMYSAFGGSRVLDIGHRAYHDRHPGLGSDADEAEDDDAFLAALDISSAGVSAFSSTALWFDLFSTGGVTVFGNVAGGTSPLSATLSGVLKYVYE